MIVNVTPFPPDVLRELAPTDKEQFRKLVEEAAEAFSAYESGNADSMQEELADVVQAAFNCCERMNLNMRNGLNTVYRKNYLRGCYGSEGGDSH